MVNKPDGCGTVGVVILVMAALVWGIVGLTQWSHQRDYDRHVLPDGQPTGDGTYIKVIPVKYYEAWVYHHPDAIVLETQHGKQDTWNHEGNLIIRWKHKEED